MRRIYLLTAIAVLPPAAARADESDAHYKQCLAYKQQGKLDEAVQECQKALELRQTAACHFTMGNIYRQRSQWDYAQAHLEAGLQALAGSEPSAELADLLHVRVILLGRRRDCLESWLPDDRMAGPYQVGRFAYARSHVCGV